MKIDKNIDIFGNSPEIGDIIIFNPPQFKGLSYGTCIGFTDVGCPKINNVKGAESYSVEYCIRKGGFYFVKTNFVIKGK